MSREQGAVARPHRRLFWRVYRSGLLVLALLASIFVTAGVVLERVQDEHRPGGGLATYLAQQAARTWGDPARLEEELLQAERTLHVDLAVGGLTNAPAPPRPAGLEAAPLSPEELRRVEAGESFGPHKFEEVAPVLVDGRPVGYLTLRFFRRPGGRHGLLPWPVNGLLALLVGLAFLSYGLARAISAPVEQLTRAVRSLGRGDLSARTGVQRADELGDLAGAFDEMADRVSRLILGEKELLANVSHELRTPLARIRLALELVTERGAGPAQEYLSEIGLSLSELEALVEELLTAARLDLANTMRAPGAAVLRLERLTGRDLVEEAARRFRSAHPSRALEVELAEGLPEVEVDAVMVQRLLGNLLDNARKYSDAERPVRLRARAVPEGLRVEVLDQGIGVEPGDLDKLFTPLFRTDRSRNRDTGGVGLGLYIARLVAEAHRGRLGVESEPGLGSTFWLELPGASPS